jgi:hypothetical protein
MAHSEQLNQLNCSDSTGEKDRWHRWQVRNSREDFLIYVLGASLVLVVFAICGIRVAAAAEPTLPEFEQVARAAENYFRSLKDFQAGDLISQQHVAAALEAVAKVGWELPNRDKITQQALADGSFLVRELSKKSGQKFMRKIAKTPGGYERLERLSSISGGERTVRELISKPGGDEMIEYLATTRGGHNLGRMMAGAQYGVNLNKPTGRIYTADEFMSVLRQAYKQTATP